MGFFDFLGQVINAVSDFSENVPVSGNPNDFSGVIASSHKKTYFMA